MLVLDNDKNGKVTTDEVAQTLDMLEKLLSEGDPESEYVAMLRGTKAAAPHLFRLLDMNGDDALTKTELLYATLFDDALKSGDLRALVRDCFVAIDADGDDRLSADEMKAAIDPDGGEALIAVSAKVHALFPLRSDPSELNDFLRSGLESVGGVTDDGLAKGMSYVDADGDGFIDRKEAGRAYNRAGKRFLEVSKTVKSMGPMMAMFGSGMMGEEF